MLLEHVAQRVIQPGALGASVLVSSGLEMEEAEQALALDVTGAVGLVGAGVLVLHPMSVSTCADPGKKGGR